MAGKWTGKRYVLAGAGSLALLAAAGAAAVYTVGSQLLASFLEQTLSAAPDREVRIGGLTFAGLSKLHVTDIAIADQAGVWLRAPVVDITWSPRQLLEGELLVHAIDGPQVTVSRWPEGKGSETEFSPPAFKWPSLPLAVSVERADVAALNLPAVAEQETPPLVLSARARLNESDLAIELGASGPAGDEAMLDLAAERPKETLRLTFKIVSDTKGSLTSAMRASGLPRLDAVDIRFAGKGSWRAWRADMAAQMPGVAAFAGVATIDNGERLTLKGKFLPEGGWVRSLSLPALVDERVREETDVAASLTLDDDGAPRSGIVALTAPRLRLRLASDAERRWSSADVSARIDGVAWPDSGVTVDRLSASGQVNGWRGPVVAAALGVKGRGINVKSATIAALDGHVEGEFHKKSKGLSVSASGRLLDVMTSWWPKVAEAAWTVRGSSDDGNRIAVDGFTLDAAPARLQATATADIGAGSAAAKGTFALSDLLPLSQGWRGGSLALDFALTHQDRTRLTLSGSGTGNGKGRLDALGPLTLKGVLDLSDSQRAAFEAKTPAVAVTGRYGQRGDDRRLAASLTVIQGKPVGDLLGVDLSDQARIDINYRQDNFLLRVQAPWLWRENGGLHGVTASLRLHNPLGNPDGAATLSASTPVGPLRLVSGVKSDESRIALPGIFMDTPVATILGDVSIDRASGVLSGQLAGSSGDLLALRKGLDIDAGGEFRLDLTLAPEIAADGQTLQAVSGNVTGRALSLVLADGETLSLDDFKAEGRTVVDVKGPPGRRFRGAEGMASVRGFRAATVDLKTADIAFDPAADGVFPWRLSADGNYYGDLKIQAAGGFAVNGGAHLTIASLDGLLAARPIALSAPTAAAWDAEGWRLDPADFTVGSGKASLAAALTSTQGELQAAFEDADLGILSLLAGREPLSGTVSGKAELSLSQDRALGRLDLTAHDVTEAANDGLSPRFEVGLKGNLTGSRETLPAHLSASVTGAGISASAAVDLPVMVRQNGRPHVVVDETAALDGHLIWQGPIGPLVLLTSMSEDSFGGDLSADVKISGTLQQPLFNGRLALNQGRYENLRWGAGLLDVTAEARLNGQHIEIAKFTGKDANGGSASAAGALSFEDFPHVTGDIEATLDRARVVRVGTVTALASGALKYQRTRSDAVLAGQLKLDEAEISLSNKLPPEIPSLDVREIHGAQTVALSDGAKNTLPTVRRLDLEVTSPRRAWVRGRGLDSEWSGHLYIRGDANEPEVEGTLDALHGTFDFAGKTFTLTSGNLRFAGGRTLDPAIVIKAEYSTFDLKSILLLEGSLSQPKLTLTSTPPLPQDEIMARILFGAGVQSLTPLEAVQLAGAVSSLSSGGGWDVFAIARNALSLDRLSVGASGDRSAGAQVTGGKYLTDRVYLELRTDTDTGASNATLRVDVTKHLQVESDVGSEDGNRFGLRWKKDY